MRLSKRILLKMLDDTIDELARKEVENREIKEKAFTACKLVESLAQQIKNLESEVESLQLSESFYETRDYNRARIIGMQLQEGE